MLTLLRPSPSHSKIGSRQQAHTVCGASAASPPRRSTSTSRRSARASSSRFFSAPSSSSQRSSSAAFSSFSLDICAHPRKTHRRLVHRSCADRLGSLRTPSRLRCPPVQSWQAELGATLGAFHQVQARNPQHSQATPAPPMWTGAPASSAESAWQTRGWTASYMATHAKKLERAELVGQLACCKLACTPSSSQAYQRLATRHNRRNAPPGSTDFCLALPLLRAPRLRVRAWRARSAMHSAVPEARCRQRRRHGQQRGRHHRHSGGQW